MTISAELLAEFIQSTIWHGTLDRADAMLAAHPELATSGIHAAAILGDDESVRRFLALDPASATATAPPYGGDALNYLGLSKYLRLDRSRTDRFLRAATALLDAGADPNTGFWTTGQYPERETALYGAAGVAHHPELTRLLLERGADPNDEEVVYHSPETDDNAAMKLVVETGRVTPANLTMMLIRKHDWHDYDGAKYLLEHGADPNHDRPWGLLAIHHAIARDNSLAMIELELDHGADPTRIREGMTAIQLAAHRGRGDVLAAFERRGIPLALGGVDALISACARGDAAAAHTIAAAEPALVQQLIAQGGTLLAQFAGTGNRDGVSLLLDLGVDIDARYGGDGYFGTPPGSTALHVAAWRAWHGTVRALIERGASLDVRDGDGRTPLMLAVRACVDSYWTERRKPDSIRLLLEAGASAQGISLPTGYAEADALLASHGRSGS